MLRKFRPRVSRYPLTLVRLMTFRSATFARLVRISSCTPSAKNAFSLFSLRFSNGRTATLLLGAVMADAPAADAGSDFALLDAGRFRDHHHPMPTATRITTAIGANLDTSKPTLLFLTSDV